MPIATKETPITKSSIANPFLTNDDYDLQYDDWVMLADFYEGARQVKSKRANYLPMTELEQKEEAKGSATQKTSYQYRLERAVFINGVARLTRFAISNLFRVPPKLPEFFTKKNKDIVENADMLGTNMTQYMRNVCTKAYVMGHQFVVVDMPSVLPDSAAEQKKKGFRPYCVMVDPRNVVDWSIVQDVNGAPYLEWVVIRSVEYEPRVPFRNPSPYECYKIWYPDRWEKWKLVLPTGNNNKQSNLVRLEEGPNELGEVPAVAIYSNQIRPMVSSPPLLESAHLNHVHYMTYSSFNNGLLYHLNPVLALIGVNETDVKLGSNRALQLPTGSEVKYVEYTGQNLSIAKQASEQLAQEVMEAGLRTTAMLGANTSAEARKLTRADFNSFLLAVASMFEYAFTDVFRLIDRWQGVEDHDREEYRPTFNRDYDVALVDAATATFYLNAWEKNAISHGTFLRSLRRGELLDDDTDINNEIIQTAKERLENLKQDQQAADFEARLKSAIQPVNLNPPFGGPTAA